MFRDKNGRFKKGGKPWNWKGEFPNCLDCGKKLSARRYKRCIICGNKTPEKREKSSLARKGKPAWNVGIAPYKITEETRKKMSEANKGNKSTTGLLGENANRWIKDRTKIKKQEERNNPNDKHWKYQVYKRDNFKCKINNKDCGGRMEAHHILRWRDYPELRYEVNNGITLCLNHHPRKRKEEEEQIIIFQNLLKTVK